MIRRAISMGLGILFAVPRSSPAIVSPPRRKPLCVAFRETNGERSLVTQRDHRVHAHRAPRRNVARKQRDAGQ